VQKAIGGIGGGQKIRLDSTVDGIGGGSQTGAVGLGLQIGLDGSAVVKVLGQLLGRLVVAITGSHLAGQADQDVTQVVVQVMLAGNLVHSDLIEDGIDQLLHESLEVVVRIIAPQVTIVNGQNGVSSGPRGILLLIFQITEQVQQDAVAQAISVHKDVRIVQQLSPIPRVDLPGLGLQNGSNECIVLGVVYGAIVAGVLNVHDDPVIAGNLNIREHGLRHIQQIMSGTRVSVVGIGGSGKVEGHVPGCHIRIILVRHVAFLRDRESTSLVISGHGEQGITGLVGPAAEDVVHRGGQREAQLISRLLEGGKQVPFVAGSEFTKRKGK